MSFPGKNYGKETLMVLLDVSPEFPAHSVLFPLKYSSCIAFMLYSDLGLHTILLLTLLIMTERREGSERSQNEKGRFGTNTI